MSAPSRHGFTLVELSLVLVIIGLVVGGVLVGRDLIEAGRIRAQLSQIADMETQINTFKIKYDCLPGDCATATSALGATHNGNAVVDGNGDGIIKGQYAYTVSYGAGECLIPDVTGEVSQLLMQLTASGLAKYSSNGNSSNNGRATLGKEYTEAAYGNGTGLFVSCLGSLNWPTITPVFLRKGNIIVFGVAPASLGELVLTTGILGSVFYGGYGDYGSGTFANPIGIPADAIRKIDEKIDDGKPSSGKVGIFTGDTGCAANVAAYPAPSIYCRATAVKRIE